MVKTKFRLFIVILLMVPIIACSLIGCETLKYYGHVSKGHLSLINAREPIDNFIDSEETDEKVKQKLRLVKEARHLASDIMGLPKNDSYLSYVELERDHVIWNVFAAPEFDLSPYTRCFPFVGCLSYQGYFSKTLAENKAAKLSGKGYDTYVGGVTAYSTLGWFDDPMLSTMIRRNDLSLVGLIFHELAHQHLYIQDDTAFNESFATAVELEGIRIWLEKTGAHQEDYQNYQVRRQRHRQFIRLLLDKREQLETIYASNIDEAAMRQQKDQALQSLHQEFYALRDAKWNGYSGYDRWFDKPINNARLIPVSLYHDWVPAFQILLKKHNYHYEAFYTEVRELGKKPKEERINILKALLTSQVSEVESR